MKPWVVVPLGRADSVGNVFSNFRRQSVEARLCIVENGAGLGACERHGLNPDLLLTSQNHQAHAKNQAISELRDCGGHLAFWDDDDWYGRAFLEELLASAGRATVVGKRRHFVRLPSGLFLFDSQSANRASSWLHGPTCLVRAAECLTFPVVSPNDDGAWCKAMRAAGASFYATSIWGYIYDRTNPGHVWNASEKLVRWQLGDAIKGGCLIKAPTGDEVLSDMT